jgi:type II secretory pathway component GspD/PulD (secretin)
LSRPLEAKADRSFKAQTLQPKEKTYVFELRDQPWAKVFERYSEITELPFVSNHRLQGKANFIPPEGKREYTLTEITDLLSEMLFAKKYIFAVRESSFTVLPAGEEVCGRVALIRVKDLGKRGKMELGSMILRLTTLKAKELGPEVKKMMAPFGRVVVLEKSNTLCLFDTVGNLRRVHQMIKAREVRQTGK